MLLIAYYTAELKRTHSFEQNRSIKEASQEMGDNSNSAVKEMGENSNSVIKETVDNSNSIAKKWETTRIG